MKAIIFIVTLLICSCKNKTTQNKNVANRPIVKTLSIQDTNILLPKSKADRKKYYTTKDTVYIYSVTKDTIKYSKKEFNGIIDDYPELYEAAVNNPDSTYSRGSFFVLSLFYNKQESALQLIYQPGASFFFLFMTLLRGGRQERFSLSILTHCFFDSNEFKSGNRLSSPIPAFLYQQSDTIISPFTLFV